LSFQIAKGIARVRETGYLAWKLGLSAFRLIWRPYGAKKKGGGHLKSRAWGWECDSEEGMQTQGRQIKGYYNISQKKYWILSVVQVLATEFESSVVLFHYFLTRKKLALSYTQYTKHTSGRLSVCFENP
jgi:hypothetical protein